MNTKTNVNWQEQWELFCPYFQKGLCKFPLSSKITLILQAGGGFGDLSHPTTHLVLNLMKDYVKNKTVIDIGCGSGVLGISAVLLGASKAYCIDICKEALEHTYENSILNHVSKQVWIGSTLPKKEFSNSILLMNMTFGDQLLVIDSIKHLETTWICSGILQSQHQSYVDWISSYQKNLIKSTSQNDWMGYIWDL